MSHGAIVFIASHLGILATAILSLPHVASRYILIGGPPTRALRASHYCREFHDLPGLGIAHAPALATQLVDLERRYGRLCLVPIEEDVILLTHAAAAGRDWTVIAPPAELVRRLSDKWEFFRICRQAGLPVPATLRFDTPGAATPEALAELGPRLVGKPVAGGGGQGVFVSTPENFAADLARQATAACPQLVQRHIAGEDVDISLLAADGRILRAALQSRDAGGALHFVADAELLAHARRLIAATGYSGLVHIDARRESGSGRIFLIEANTRAWASLAHAALAGMNFLGAALQSAASERLQEEVLPATLTPVTWRSARRQALLAGIGLAPACPARRTALLRRWFDPVLLKAMAGAG